MQRVLPLRAGDRGRHSRRRATPTSTFYLRGLRRGQMTTGRVPKEAFQASMGAARSAVVRILQHPNAAQILEEFAPAIRDMAGPELAPDQLAITDLALAVGSWPHRTGWLRPDAVPALHPEDPTSVWPLYVDNADPRCTGGPWCLGWPTLPEQNRLELHTFVGVLRRVVVTEAGALKASGVPVDPGSPLDLSALVQLALLDVQGTPDEVASVLNLVPPYALSGDGRDLRNVRDGTSEQVERAASTVRRWWRSQQEDNQREALKDRGGRPSGSRTVGTGTGLVYEHLPSVLARFGNVNGAKLCRDWRRNVKGSAGVMLRDLMGERAGDAPPALRTLQRALKDLRQ
jgi:hypothetical protein